MTHIQTNPGDFLDYVEQTRTQFKNITQFCVPVAKIDSKGFLVSFSSLVLLQFSLVSLVLTLVSRILKPIGQSTMVAQLLGAIILGPSFLGQSSGFLNSVFPLTSLELLDVIATFGFIFYFFLIGVQMDPSIIKKLDKTALAIGVFTVIAPNVLSTSCFLILKHFVSEEDVANSLPLVALAESALSFPMTAYFLAELRIINSEFGRVALSSSVVSNICNFCLITISLLQHQSAGESYQMLTTTFNGIAFTAVILAIRPALMWMIRQNPDGEPLKQNYITVLCIAVLIAGFCSQAVGLNTYYGPLVLGLILPAGPPVGSTLTEKLDPMISWVFLPLYFVKIGLTINIFVIKMKQFLIVQCIALMAAVGKFLGAFITSQRCQIPRKDAILLGLVMNFQGVLELGLFKALNNKKAIDNGSFVIMCTSMLLLTGTITPIIRHLCDPSRRYVVYTRRTIMHSRPDSELRIVVCIHDQANVPTAVNILEALNPTRQSPINIYMLHFIELVGRTNPLLIPHSLNKSPPYNASASERIVNVFRHFEESYHRVVSVFPFTAISPPQTMHDNICSMALEKRTSLIMVPFHKRFHANGTMTTAKQAAKISNKNVIDMAPCSVAIIVDRGLLNTSRFFLQNWCSYHVAVLFLGGADDREALALGLRMAGHPSINLTLIHILNKNINDDDVNDRRLDKEVVSMFRTNMIGNSRVRYTEEEAIDASDTVAVIRSMENNYELVIVGRNHDNQSSLLSGLTFWDEQMELGAIGHVLASADFMGNTTILVVQQHTNRKSQVHEGDLGNHNCIVEAKDAPFQRIV